jgi:hypothetical protein
VTWTERKRTIVTRTEQTLTRSLFLQTPVGEPSERLVVVTISLGSWLETDSSPISFETAIFETDETQQPVWFVTVAERYRTAREAFDGHNRWCQMLDQPRQINRKQQEDSE